MPPKKKKGGKGKKKGGSGGVLGEEIRTTQRMIVERGKMLCPRLGDHFTRTMQAEEILEVSSASLIEISSLLFY
jgi:hypothetical protein